MESAWGEHVLGEEGDKSERQISNGVTSQHGAKDDHVSSWMRFATLED
jgi:hypothetical protein